MSVGTTLGTSQERLGRYRLNGVIGVGSFATAHLATDERLDDAVVVKVLAENHSLNPEVRERFISEGRSLRRVRSAHVVTVHDIGESERQQPYLVLEHADRGTLSRRVASLRATGWTASVADVLSLARPLAQALQDVHAARIVHRDLSPTNVLLSSAPADGPVGSGRERSGESSRLIGADERVLLADLGMCKDLALNSGLTVAGGTSGFRPPEMESGPAVIDTRADLWSLSALIRWLTDGAGLPTQLGPVLDRSLSLKPGDRHRDVGQWLAEVEVALSPPEPDAPAADDGVQQQSTVGSAGPEVAVLKRPVAWLILGGLLITGVLLGWQVRGGNPPATSQTSQISIMGPDGTSTGEAATFTLERESVESWVWELPNGTYVTNQGAVTLTPSGAGRATLIVRAQAQDGTDLYAEHSWDVSDR